MKLLNVEIPMKSRSTQFVLYPLGDTHIGKKNCAETPLRRRIASIAKEAQEPGKVVRVIQGGDITNSITSKDLKRFSFQDLPKWALEGDADTVRERLSNIALAEGRRAVDIFRPVAALSLGAVRGTHEAMVRSLQGIDVHGMVCAELGIIDLTDEAFIRLTFRLPCGLSSVCFLYIQHGHLTGRSEGAEPVNLSRLRDEWQAADIVLRGHSHTFDIRPPKPVLYLPDSGEIPEELRCRYRFAGNWGCWLYSHSVGSGTYESEKTYPARPLLSLRITIEPFRHTSRKGKDLPYMKINMTPYDIV
jgi:hypothetical protein